MYTFFLNISKRNFYWLVKFHEYYYRKQTLLFRCFLLSISARKDFVTLDKTSKYTLSNSWFWSISGIRDRTYLLFMRYLVDCSRILSPRQILLEFPLIVLYLFLRISPPFRLHLSSVQSCSQSIPSSASVHLVRCFVIQLSLASIRARALTASGISYRSPTR